MTTVIVETAVADFEAWRPIFESHADVRLRHGCSSATVFQRSDDPNAVTVICEFPSVAAAEAFQQDPTLAATMQSAGVLAPPKVTYLEPADR
jgi:quinol monooxygenase YgiN